LAHNTTERKGLTDKEAESRLAAEGYNELPTAKKRNVLHIALEVAKEPMFILLIACGTIYLILGDFQEAMMLLGFVFVIMGITFYQERKTERAIEALRDLSSPRALVIRGGEYKKIAGRDVVREDLVIVSEGDRVPADAVVIESDHLTVDESLLTGESVPVRKVLWDGAMQKAPPGGDDLPFIYSGTLVVQGQCIAKVLSTGINTEIGKIGKALQSVEIEGTPLQKETGRIVRSFALLGLVMCIIVIVGYGLTRGDWLEGFLAGITLAMALLPEEFPVVLTIFLALGAWRISQRNVLTRRIPAIETLGSASVLCVDKTGTLTQNRMTVTALYNGKEHLETKCEDPLPEDFHEVIEFGSLASKPEPFDPMEKALRQHHDVCLSNTEHVHLDWTLVHEYPLSRGLLAMSQVWSSPNGVDYVIAAKGAPEAIADLCHFNEAQNAALFDEIGHMANDGLRVLGIAKASFKKTDLPGHQHDFVFNFVGLVGFVDPVRPTVANAVKECYSAGIRVVMITGDYPATAQCIAREIGLRNPEKVITGPELLQMEVSELQERVKDANIFARVVPEQKLLIVNALKLNGEVVAMTGDGVNDAPALKSAHIGIAMGNRGTDVARESAALVLLDDAFDSIVSAVRLGRRIYDNIRKSMSYIISVHIPIAGISVIPILMGWPLILLPMHIVFLELIIDPTCSVVFEAEKEEKNVMSRSPRNQKERMFNKRTIALCVLQGLIILAFMSVILFSRLSGNPYVADTPAHVAYEDYTRTLMFASLVVANLGLIMSNRTWSQNVIASLRTKNTAFWGVCIFAFTFLASVIYVPFLRELFHFEVLNLGQIGICAVVGVGCVTLFEILKAALVKEGQFQ
jgi:Ca2+-transporting ATPase